LADNIDLLVGVSTSISKS